LQRTQLEDSGSALTGKACSSGLCSIGSRRPTGGRQQKAGSQAHDRANRTPPRALWKNHLLLFLFSCGDFRDRSWSGLAGVPIMTEAEARADQFGLARAPPFSSCSRSWQCGRARLRQTAHRENRAGFCLVLAGDFWALAQFPIGRNSQFHPARGIAVCSSRRPARTRGGGGAAAMCSSGSPAVEKPRKR